MNDRLVTAVAWQGYWANDSSIDPGNRFVSFVRACLRTQDQREWCCWLLHVLPGPVFLFAVCFFWFSVFLLFVFCLLPAVLLFAFCLLRPAGGFTFLLFAFCVLPAVLLFALCVLRPAGGFACCDLRLACGFAFCGLRLAGGFAFCVVRDVAQNKAH